MTTKFYTSSKGDLVEIETMPYPYLKSAHDKAVRTEERRHEEDPDYDNPAREAEITSMKARLDRLDAEHADAALAEADEDGRGPAAEED